jgi:hypothetical protein
MIRFVRAILAWLLKEPRIFWLMVTVLFAAGVVAFWPETTEPRIRITGWVLELFGLGTVAWGLQETRRQFGRPDFLAIVRAWWARRPKMRRQIVTGAVHVPGGGTVSATGYAWHGTSPTPTLEDRVAALEANVRGVNEHVNQVQRELRQEVTARDEALSSERRAREKENTEIKQKLESAETGGLHVSMMGVIWLAAGLTLSTIPNEILCVFK